MLMIMTRRTTIEMDEDLLSRARAVLGTSGIKDTVDAALTDVVRREQLRRFADEVVTGKLFEMDPTLRDQMWR